MPHKPENADWPDYLSDRDPDYDRPQQFVPENDTADSDFKASRAHPAAAASQGGKAAARKRKMEDLNDREDLSERILTDRNWQ